jgi:hypothetical protein
MNKVLGVLAIAFICLTFAVAGCKQKLSWQEELKKAAAENKYSVLFITDGKSAACKTMQIALQESSRTLSSQFKIIEVNAEKEQYTLLKLQKIMDLSKVPQLLIFAPNGAITGTYGGEVTPAALQNFVVSPREANVLLALQKNKTVFLCLHQGASDELKAVEAKLKEIGKNFAAKVSVHFVDSSDQENAKFIKNLPPVTSKLAVLAITPTGTIAATLEGPRLTAENLLKTAESVAPAAASK